VIDTHCHLTFPEFEGRVPEVLARAAMHGVTGCITISTTPANAEESLALATAHPNVWCTAGVHPGYSAEVWDERSPAMWQRLARVAAHPRCVAWGELGLDNHWPDPPRAKQDVVLAEHLECIAATHSAWAASTGRRLPIVIHCREAFDDLLPILKASALPPDRFVFHCFTGTIDEARRVLDFGAMISFTGIATYKNAAEVMDAAKLTPLDRLMIETDAPFLPPEPHRKARPCEPWMASVTAAAIAAARGLALGDFLAAIDANTERFFGITVPTSTHRKPS
jgi:TatD DNase family protein